MSKYNTLKKKHSNLSLSYNKSELDNKDNISEIKILQERVNHMIENRSLKERHIPHVLKRKPLVMNKKVFNHRKKSFMHTNSFIDKYVCYACNQAGHLKFNCPTKHKGLKCIWIPKGTMTSNVGPKIVWIPKV